MATARDYVLSWRYVTLNDLVDSMGEKKKSSRMMNVDGEVSLRGHRGPAN